MINRKEVSYACDISTTGSVTTSFQQGDELIPEMDSYVDGVRKRVPNLTYFTAEQKQAIGRSERIKTPFAIEILSDSESHQDMLNKIQDYFDGGAQLVWSIIPKQQKVYVYLSPDESRAYKGLDLITTTLA